MIRDVGIIERTSDWRRGGLVDLKKVRLMSSTIFGFLRCQENKPETRYIVCIDACSNAPAERRRSSRRSVSNDRRSVDTQERWKQEVIDYLGTPNETRARGNNLSYIQYLKLGRDSFFEPLHEDQRKHQDDYEANREQSTSSYDFALSPYSSNAMTPRQSIYSFSRNSITPSRSSTGGPGTRSTFTTPKDATPKRSPLVRLWSFLSGSSPQTPQANSSVAPLISKFQLNADDAELAMLHKYILRCVELQ